MKTYSLKFSILLFSFLAIMISFGSCADDEVTGCMDANADNFDPMATIAGDCTYLGCMDPIAENYDPQANTDDNSCVYPRDKFIGDYLGSFTCPGILAAINSDSLVFSIEPGLDATLPHQVIITISVSGIAVPLTATASGNTLSDINAELMGVPLPQLGGIPTDVEGSGSATISADHTTLNAIVTLKLSALGGFPNDCMLVGIKM